MSAFLTQESDVVDFYELGPRERQNGAAVYRIGEAAVAEVRRSLSDPLSYSAARPPLNLLAAKNLLILRHLGKRCLEPPVTPKTTMRRSALRKLARNFFSDRSVEAVAALLDGGAGCLKPEDLECIKKRIENAEARS
ncbi:MAG TPA: BlaI/MecI/CopY family transcriptional regulator [Planctomycetaceae bacterium]|nr:BlaI/MecI/CopY family transcriptional regulator [Planctomycetaceae bacterium]